MTTPDIAPRCEALGELKVNGETIATMRCALESGHEKPVNDGRHLRLPIPQHRAIFEWTEPRLHYPSLVIDE